MKANHLFRLPLGVIIALCFFFQVFPLLGEDDKTESADAVFLNPDRETPLQAEIQSEETQPAEGTVDHTKILIFPGQSASLISLGPVLPEETPLDERPVFEIKGLFPDLTQAINGSVGFKSLFDLRKPLTSREMANRHKPRVFIDDKKDVSAGWVLISFGR